MIIKVTKLNTYGKKIKHIIPSFFIVVWGTVILLSVVRWLVSVKFLIIDVNEDIWELWIPMLLPWIPIWVWMRKRLRVLTFNRAPDNDNGRFFFQVVIWIIMVFTLTFSQAYFTTATGKLQKISSVQEINKHEKSRYYKIGHFFVIDDVRGVYNEFNISGKHNQYFNMSIYFVFPIVSSLVENINSNPKVWYGVKYTEQISNKISIEEKESRYNAFYDKCAAKMRYHDFYALDHFKRTPTSDDKLCFFKAIEAKTHKLVDNNFVILEPMGGSYESRNGNKFIWIFVSFGIGLCVLLLGLLFTGFSEKEFQKFKIGKI